MVHLYFCIVKSSYVLTLEYFKHCQLLFKNSMREHLFKEPSECYVHTLTGKVDDGSENNLIIRAL